MPVVVTCCQLLFFVNICCRTLQCTNTIISRSLPVSTCARALCVVAIEVCNFTHSHTLPYSHSLPPSLTHTRLHTRTLARTLTRTLTRILTYTHLALCESHTRSLTLYTATSSPHKMARYSTNYLLQIIIINSILHIIL
jgi:hypothetical protein